MTNSTVARSAPSASQDLFHEVFPKSTLLACRGITDDIIQRAVEAIRTGLPKQIVSLTELIRRSEEDESFIFHPKWDCRWPKDPQRPERPSTSEASSESGSGSDGWLPNGDGAVATMQKRDGPVSQVNLFRPPEHVVELLSQIASIADEIGSLLDLVQLYIICMTPPVEEGNNTGVEVQQHCLRTVNDARRYVVTIPTYQKQYHEQRAKLASKVLKYPALEDYRRALVARDEEECRDCRYILKRIRVQVIAVVDPIHKNYSRITEPKGAASGGAGMY